MIKSEIIFKQFSYKECLAHTPTAIYSHKLSLIAMKYIHQLLFLPFSPNNLCHDDLYI